MYSEIYDFGNLYTAYKLCRKCKRWKGTVNRFEKHTLENILELSETLKNESYQPGSYNMFTIYEPKQRTIMSNSFRDKVVQRCLCNFVLYPVASKQFIYDNGACQVGKGMHFAHERLKEFLHAHYRRFGDEGYVLKCDISKYFYTIDHEILRDKLKKIIHDDRVMNLLNKIIDSSENPGIPIGNQTSQIFALLYLSDMDHYIKEKLCIKYYTRYQDDFILIHPDREYLKHCKNEIEKFMKELKLTLNKKTEIYPLSNGVKYLGFHFYLTESGKVIQKVLTKKNKKIGKRVADLESKFLNGEIDLDSVLLRYNTWRAHAAHGTTFYFLEKCDSIFLKTFSKYLEEVDVSWQY